LGIVDCPLPLKTARNDGVGGKPMIRRFVVIAALALGPAAVQAQNYPSQDVHLICAFPAGSGADIIVRFYAEKLRPIMKQIVLVENRVGALGNIATEYVARSKPDGHTIYVTGGTAITTSMYLFKNRSINAEKELQVAATINRQSTMLVVGADRPWRSVADLTADLKSRKSPGTYGHTNPNGRVMGALYKELAKFDAVEVGYRGTSDALNDLVSGQLDFALFDNLSATSLAREGRVRILGMSAPQRLQSTPDIPTMAEQGVAIGLTAWFAAMVPSTTPRPVVDQINAMFNQVTGSDDGRKFLTSIASDPWPTTPDEAKETVAREIKAWGDYVKIAKIEPQG
jgi:tripartite-type tricarboxylate transporter receptor subunit TctC